MAVIPVLVPVPDPDPGPDREVEAVEVQLILQFGKLGIEPRILVLNLVRDQSQSQDRDLDHEEFKNLKKNGHFFL